jgi:hypothetical protein
MFDVPCSGPKTYLSVYNFLTINTLINFIATYSFLCFYLHIVLLYISHVVMSSSHDGIVWRIIVGGS